MGTVFLQGNYQPSNNITVRRFLKNWASKALKNKALKDGGHQAYADESWINPILFPQSQDLDQITLISSAYSIHPNERGAQAYADCVNYEIEMIAARRKSRTGDCSATENDHVTRRLNTRGVLAISGTGKMKDYESSYNAPLWVAIV